ncbi:cell surface protein [Listeria ivanovii subsp. londoniensis]|uniref:cell surface protein n=1 Tax=Listeria ivanovii TaxID=1638 RepID=UPI0019077C2F|nr:cell surface protein [Listeria ivanovii]MBK2002720.1 cell surface protein [Listeria ivanovii subsp. londoniensis]
MKKKTIAIIVFTTCLLVMSCFLVVNTYTNKAATPKKEVPIYEIYSDYTLDVDKPEEVVGDADYVFVGEVTKEIGTNYKNKTPIEQANGEIEYIGEAYTQYELDVITNLKNELPTAENISIEKQGGLREDGSAYDVFEGDQLPKVGQIYIFTAYEQDDDSLLVAGANSTISFDEKTKELDSNKEVRQTEEVELYEEAVENPVVTIEE